ncbi:MAG TPA: hypothetical protein VK081_15170 [Planctomycetota bacterium]|nr:hypothetical protein [Planctomycetota bacterium]
MGGPDAGRGRSTWRGRLARRAGDVAARLHLRASPLRRLVRGRGRRFTGRLALVAVALLAAVVAWPAPPDRHRAILDAIHFVETGGRDPCPDGDGGRAIGPYQIHRVYWLDAVAFDPSLGPAAGFDYEDCRRRDYAERVIAAYMQRWVPDAWRTGDAEVIARTHNGGPRGAQSGATAGYWSRVRAYLGE